MKAIRFNASIPRYTAGLAMKKLSPAFMWSGATCTYVEQVDEPDLPSPAWVKIKTRLGGICGSDLSAIHLHSTPYLEPYTSFPYTFGHENVGVISELGQQVEGFEKGERVVAEPLLWCTPRGIKEPCRFCKKGLINLCERTTDGDLSAGISIGFCKDTGGSWSPVFTAHQSALYRMPTELSDENALMIEPLASGLHPLLNNFPNDEETVLICGAGTIGLCLLAALRALGSKARVMVLARYTFQAAAARRLGADQVVSSARGEDYYSELAELTGARIFKPTVGKRVFEGGVDRTFECTGSNPSIDDALRLTRAGGRVVLVGMPGIAKGIDLTAVFKKELDLRAAFCYHHAEEYQGQRWSTFGLALDLLKCGKLNLGWLVTHRFRLDQYKQVFGILQNKSKHEVIKAAFEFDR